MVKHFQPFWVLETASNSLEGILVLYNQIYISVRFVDYVHNVNNWLKQYKYSVHMFAENLFACNMTRGNYSFCVMPK